MITQLGHRSWITQVFSQSLVDSARDSVQWKKTFMILSIFIKVCLFNTLCND